MNQNLIDTEPGLGFAEETIPVAAKLGPMGELLIGPPDPDGWYELSLEGEYTDPSCAVSWRECLITGKITRARLINRGDAK